MVGAAAEVIPGMALLSMESRARMAGRPRRHPWNSVLPCIHTEHAAWTQITEARACSGRPVHQSVVDVYTNILSSSRDFEHCVMMSILCNCCVRE
jgi:hypothetical protein